MNQDLVPINIATLYSSRVVILIESAPQSNLYNQVLLTKEQFFAISDVLYKVHGGSIELKNNIKMTIDDQVIKLPEDLTDFR